MAMTRTLARPAGGLNPTRWLVSDPARLPDPAPVLSRLPPGWGLIWRPYGLDPRAALAQGRRLRRLTRRRRIVFLVAGDARLAAAVGADGLHLPEGMARHGILAPALAWRRTGDGRWLSVAGHGPLALARARSLGGDLALFSPVFPTRSHPGGPVLGPLRFALVARRAGLPVVALGGVTRATARRLPPGSAAGLAAVSGWAEPRRVV
jgi:thiamine-phosphate pyrophosphorylase